MNPLKIAVIGGGAAGFFAALSCKQHYPSAIVTIYEKTDKLLSKVKVSGGGRCNVTHACFSNAQLVKFYPRGGNHLKKIFSQFNAQDTIEWFQNRGVRLKTEEDGRMFPVTDSPVIIIFPAMGTRASYYHPFAKALAEKGIIAVTADLRGIGNSSVHPKRGVDFGFNEMLELDYKGIIEKINSLYPGRKKFILGHSLGGILGSLYLSKYPKDAEGLILVAACNIYYRGWSGLRKWWLLFGTQMMNFFASLFGYHAGNIVGFGGIGAKTVIKDWSYTARTGNYRVKNSLHNFETSLQTLTPNALAFSFSHDILCTKEAVENLTGKFNTSSRIPHHYLVNNPSGKPYSHYNWVKDNEEVIGLVMDWLKTA